MDSRLFFCFLFLSKCLLFLFSRPHVKTTMEKREKKRNTHDGLLLLYIMYYIIHSFVRHAAKLAWLIFLARRKKFKIIKFEYYNTQQENGVQ